MNVQQFINRIKDINTAIENVKKFDANRESVELTVYDCEHIVMFLSDYRDSLLNREVAGNFSGE